MTKWLAIVVLLGACGADAPVLEIVIDTPEDGSEAYPYDGLDSIQLSIAHSGELINLKQDTFDLDETLALPDLAFGSDLVVHLSGIAAGSESAYGRTCAFDMLEGDGAVQRPHLYLSRVIRFGSVPDPVDPTREGGVGYALPDGRAVFLGGGGTLVERFDPIDSGVFDAVGGDEPIRRSGGAVAPLPDGRAMIVGGFDGSDNAIADLEVVDPRIDPGPAGRVESRAEGLAIRDHAAVTLVDGQVLVTGGLFQAAPGDTPVVNDRAWLLGFGDGGALEAPDEQSARLGTARTRFTMTRFGDEVGASVLIAGGLDETGTPLASAELYRPLDEEFQPAIGALEAPRFDHTGVRLIGGFVLIVGGFTSPGVPADGVEVFDPIQGQFTRVGTLPPEAGVTDFAVAPTPDGRLLITGGLDSGGEPVAFAYLVRFDSLNGTLQLSDADPLLVPRAGHSAVTLCDGTILVVGGTGDSSAGAERYNPPGGLPRR